MLIALWSKTWSSDYKKFLVDGLDIFLFLTYTSGRRVMIADLYSRRKRIPSLHKNIGTPQLTITTGIDISVAKQFVCKTKDHITVSLSDYNPSNPLTVKQILLVITKNHPNQSHSGLHPSQSQEGKRLLPTLPNQLFPPPTPVISCGAASSHRTTWLQHSLPHHGKLQLPYLSPSHPHKLAFWDSCHPALHHSWPSTLTFCSCCSQGIPSLGRPSHGKNRGGKH